VPGVDKAGGFTLTCPPSAALASPTTGHDGGGGGSGGSCDEERHPQPYLELAVQASPENPAAAWLWRPARQILGETLRVRIGGAFVFPPPPTMDDNGRGDSLRGVRRLVLVAGGVGVNPLVSMLGHLANTPALAERLEVQMVYASKGPRGRSDDGDIIEQEEEALLRDVVFLDRITTIFGQRRVRGSLSLYITSQDRSPSRSSSSPSSSSSSSPTTKTLQLNAATVLRHSRRVAIDDVTAVIGTSEDEVRSSLVYICGPPAMTDEFHAALTSGDGFAMDVNRIMAEKWW
jgi:hypothetical protein